MITTYSPLSNEYKALEAVANILSATCNNGYTFEVKDVYFDLGQNWLWTTIVAEKDTTSYQILCPRDHELITDRVNWNNINTAITNIITDSNRSKALANFN